MKTPRNPIVIWPLLALASCSGALSPGPAYDTNIFHPVVKKDPAPKSTDPAAGNRYLTLDGTVAKSTLLPGSCIPFFDPGDTTLAKAMSSATQEDTALVQAARNKCIYDIVSGIETSYQAYKAELRSLNADKNFGLDILDLGIQTAGTATGGAAAKTVLSALGTGVAGTKSAIDSDYLTGKTIDIIINQMDADRNAKLADLYVQMKKPFADYPMEQARNDLQEVYWAGTFETALDNLSTKTGAIASACKQMSATAKAATNAAPTSATTCPGVASTSGSPVR